MLNAKEMRVMDLIDRHQDALVSFLQQLIRFKTVTPTTGTSVTCSDYEDLQAMIAAALEQMEFATESWEVDAAELPQFPGCGIKRERDLSRMPVVVGCRRGAGGGRSLILNGHYDVVPPGLLENWHHDPFGAEIKNGRICGRGACDMKGGIAAMLHALGCIQKAGVDVTGDLTIQSVPDEETSCMGTLSCCQRGYTADAAVIPEPTDMQILIAMRGSVYGTISVFGRAGHAEMPQPHWSRGGAVNAIVKAAKVIQGLTELAEEWRTHPDKQHPYLDPDDIVPTVINGGQWTVTYPERVDIQFGATFVPQTQDKVAEIDAKLRSIAGNDCWMREHPPQLSTGEWHYGAEIAPDEPIVRLAVEACASLGITAPLRGFGSLTDAIHLINYARIPTISVGPDIQTAHMADESVDIAQLVNTAKVLALIVMRWGGPQR